jgi:serine/threonine-protein kinase ATR
MVPVSRSSSAVFLPNEGVHGAGGPSDPPPSTMAAQLISGISTTKQPSFPAEHGYLQAIMAEVSTMENNPSKPQDMDVQLDHKHKLIYVLARALLEKLGGKDPFLDVEQAVSQAAEALDVFTATIKELPEVLEYALPPGTTLRARGSAPLWVWLFPRVLTLLGQVDCEVLTDRIRKMFLVTFQAVSRSPKLWNLSTLLFLYLKESVTSEYLNEQLMVFAHVNYSYLGLFTG